MEELSQDIQNDTLNVITPKKTQNSQNSSIRVSHKIKQQLETTQDIVVEHKVDLGPEKTVTKIYSIKFDHEDKYIACACESGEVRVYNTKTESLSYVIYSPLKIPYTYIRWRPKQDSFKTRNVFLTVNSEGEIQHHHLASEKLLSTIKIETKGDKQLFCADYNIEATKFAVCGAEPVIRVYDEETRKLSRELGGKEGVMGHTSRVYCVKFDKENPNVCYSGGWDRNVNIWDLRQETAGQKKQFFGPSICGDGIDQHNNHIVTSSWSEVDQLQLWDVRSQKGSFVAKIDWNEQLKTSQDPCYLYAGQFSKVDGTLIIAGGSGANEVKIFDRNEANKAIVSIYDLQKEINTIDFGNKGECFALSGGDGILRMFSLSMVA